ncbi:molybdopterin-dependent oxidoreductase, partial [candidate division KSB1 bacterium]|nr:molybdopterin-dependent oxidoreductase [candidate division KSB1 bacterium]
ISRFMTLQLKPHPGTDLALLNCLMHVILERDLHDPEVKGLARLRSDGLERFTPVYGESVTGVPADDIIRAADLFATAAKAVIIYGAGLTQQANATANVQAVWNLALLTGNLGREGSGILPLHYTCNMQGTMDTGLMTEFLPGHKSIADAPERAQIEKQWQCKLPATKGLTLQQMINESGKKIRAMYIVGENLLWSAPDSAAAATALDKLDFLMVQDLFLTETAKKADVVLPACSFAEKEGTFTSMERRVQALQRAIPPIADSKPDYEIFTALANAFGAGWTNVKPQAVFEEIASLTPCFGGFEYKDLTAPGGTIWPCHEAAEECALFKKILGNRRGAFADVTTGRPFAEEVDEEYPFTLITGRPAFHRMTGTMISHSFTLDKEDPVATVQINTDDAKELKVRSGWAIKVKTRRGELKRTVVVTRAVPPKVIYVPIHHKDGLTQSLVNAAIETESGIPQMKMCAAKLEML